MTLKRALLIVGVVACLIAVLCVYAQAGYAKQRISDLTAQVESITGERDEAVREQRRLSAENAELRYIAERANAATKRAAEAVQTAMENANARIQDIGDLPADWAQCELPAGVQDMFRAYCDAD